MKEARRCGRTPRRRGSGALELRCVLLVGLFALAPFVNSVRGGWEGKDTLGRGASLDSRHGTATYNSGPTANMSTPPNNPTV